MYSVGVGVRFISNEQPREPRQEKWDEVIGEILGDLGATMAIEDPVNIKEDVLAKQLLGERYRVTP